MSAQDDVNRTTQSVVNNIYKQIEHTIVPNVDQYITFHRTNNYSAGVCAVVQIRVGYYELPIKEEGSLFLCVNPYSAQFKRLFRYAEGVPCEFPTIAEYFNENQSGGGMNSEIKQYVDAKIAESVVQTQAMDSVAAVPTLNELSNIKGMVDARILFVEEVGRLYSYDEQSTAEIDGSSVLVSSNGIGRWIMVNNNMDGGQF